MKPLPAARAATTAGAVAAGIGIAVSVAWVAARSASEDGMADAVALDSVSPIDAARLDTVADALALERGRVVYVQLCLPCHGAHGDGRGEWAYRMTPRPANLTGARTQRRSDDELFATISEPRPGTPMLGWSAQLSQAQRRQLVGYLRWLGESAREIAH